MTAVVWHFKVLAVQMYFAVLGRNPFDPSSDPYGEKCPRTGEQQMENEVSINPETRAKC